MPRRHGMPREGGSAGRGRHRFSRGGNARVQSPTRLSKGAAPLPAWHRIGAPVGGIYREILNTDSAIYGGSNVGNAGAVMADNSPSHGMPFSLTLRLPPLGVLWLEVPA